jgi:hypothetical protein
MINDINDEHILAARLLLATLFLIFGCRKLSDFGHGKSNGAAWRSDAGPRLRPSWSFRLRSRSLSARSCALWRYFWFYTRWALRLLDIATGRKQAPIESTTWMAFQKSQHNGRVLVVAHYRCGTIFDRCIVRYCRAVTLLCLQLRVIVHCYSPPPDIFWRTEKRHIE